MPTLTPTRPTRTPTPPPQYTLRQKGRGVVRLIGIAAVALFVLMVALLTLGNNGTITHVYDKARQPEDTTTWPHPLQDWVDSHPELAKLANGN